MNIGPKGARVTPSIRTRLRVGLAANSQSPHLPVSGIGGNPQLEVGASPDLSLLACIDGLLARRQRNDDARPGLAADFAARFLTVG